MPNNEPKLRKEILERVKKIYELRKTADIFIPGKSKVNYAGRVFDEKEMCAVIDSALDFWLTLGKEAQKFEHEFAKYLGVKKALVVNSGSSANLVAVSALCSPSIDNPMQPDDEVITTASTFPTTLTPIIQNNLTPVFVDVELGTYNIEYKQIEKAISPKTRAIVFAHTLGNPAKMDVIMDIAKKHKLYVVEDTCDALDSYFNGQMCGTFGDFSTYSFYAAHHMTMGEGGAVATNDIKKFRAALSIRDWGRACYCETGEKRQNGVCNNRWGYKFEGLPIGYDHKYTYDNIGYNLKPLDIQCAMGLVQLQKLLEFTKRRKYNFNYLYKVFQKYEDKFILPYNYENTDVSWFAFPLTVKENAGFTKTEFVQFLEKHLIETRMLFSGNILKQPGFVKINRRVVGDLVNTDRILYDTFFLGVYPGMTKEKLEYIKSIVDKFFQEL